MTMTDTSFFTDPDPEDFAEWNVHDYEDPWNDYWDAAEEDLCCRAPHWDNPDDAPWHFGLIRPAIGWTWGDEIRLRIWAIGHWWRGWSRNHGAYHWQPHRLDPRRWIFGCCGCGRRFRKCTDHCLPF